MKPGSFADQFSQLTREWAEPDIAENLPNALRSLNAGMNA